MVLSKIANPPRKRPLKWIGVDSEGFNHPDGHQYTHVFSANGPDYEGPVLVSRNRPLTTFEILRHVCNLPKGYNLVGYFFKYDQNMILGDLPEEDLRILFKPEGTLNGNYDEELRIVRYGKYWIARFSTMLEIVIPRNPDAPLPKTLEELHAPQSCYVRKKIWDAGKFFQTSFIDAVTKWDVATPKELELLKEWKARRNVFELQYGQTHLEEICRYTRLENNLLVKLFSKFNGVCDSQGYQLKSWYSPGSLAKVMLKKHSIVKHLEQMPEKTQAFWNAVDWAYFGGRFEIPQAEYVDVPLFEYDINSAYPHVMRFLPCLIHGEWQHSNRTDFTGQHSLYQMCWQRTIDKPIRFGPFPVRGHSGTGFYPSGHSKPENLNSGWYWGIEVEQALKAFGDKMNIEIVQQYVYRTTCDCKPFDWVNDVYAERKRLGKDAAGIALKLGLNSLYGSLASPLSPKYCNGIWAGWITAATRAMLLEAMQLCDEPDQVHMFATDAIVTSKEIPLDIGEELGQWECTPVDAGALIIMPGVYIFETPNKSKIKTRGIDLQWVAKHKKRFYARWRSHERKTGSGVGAHIKIKTERQQFIGWGQAFARNDPSLARTWVDAHKDLTFDTPKRTPDGWPNTPADPDKIKPHGKFGNFGNGAEDNQDLFWQALVTGEQPERGYELGMIIES